MNVTGRQGATLGRIATKGEVGHSVNLLDEAIGAVY
jgi:hypothetical protein